MREALRLPRWLDKIATIKTTCVARFSKNWTIIRWHLDRDLRPWDWAKATCPLLNLHSNILWMRTAPSTILLINHLLTPHIIMEAHMVKTELHHPNNELRISSRPRSILLTKWKRIWARKNRWLKKRIEKFWNSGCKMKKSCNDTADLLNQVNSTWCLRLEIMDNSTEIKEGS